MSVLVKQLYDIVIEECDARESDREAFEHYQETHDYRSPLEYRFQGALGFGGKLYCQAGRWYVSYYYREDETPERNEMVKRANQRIDELLRQQPDSPAASPSTVCAACSEQEARE